MREDLPELRGFAHLGANNEYGSEIFDVKFYPYTQPRVDPVFAATGDHEIYICRPICRDKKVIEVLQVYRDKEVRPGCVFNSVAWTKAERSANTSRPAGETDDKNFECTNGCGDNCSCERIANPSLETETVPLLCIAGQIPKIKILNILTGEIERTFIGHGRAINDLSISPMDHNILASCSGDSTIRLWNLRPEFEEAPCVGLLAGNHHEKDILTIDFHASGRYLLAGGMDLKVTLWIIPDLPSATNKPEDVAFVMHPHFATRDIHVDMVDCVKFYGNKVISRSAKSCQIIIWSIVGFDDYVDAYDSHTHSCSDHHEDVIGDSSQGGCQECQSCPICNLQPPPPLSMELSTSSAFNLNPRSRYRDSTVGLQGETGVEILLVLDLPHSNLFYMRFGLFEPVVETKEEKQRREDEEKKRAENGDQSLNTTASNTPTIPSSSAPVSRPRNRKGAKRNAKNQPAQNEILPVYNHAILCAGNERSRFFFWDLDALETVRSAALTGPGSSLAGGAKRKRVKQATSAEMSAAGGSGTTSADGSVPNSFSTLRTLRAARASRSHGSFPDSLSLSRSFRDQAHPLSVVTSSIAESPLGSTPHIDAPSRGSITPQPQGQSTMQLGRSGLGLADSYSQTIAHGLSGYEELSSSFGAHSGDMTAGNSSVPGQIKPVTNKNLASAAGTDAGVFKCGSASVVSSSPIHSHTTLTTPNLTATATVSVNSVSSLVGRTVPGGSSVVDPVSNPIATAVSSGSGGGANGVGGLGISGMSLGVPFRFNGVAGTATSSVTTTTVTNPNGTPNIGQGNTSSTEAPLPTFQSPISDPAVLVPPHRSHKVSKVNFTVRQISWSVGGEWCVGCGDAGMLAVFGRT